jgi:hypothetical protein
MTTRWLAAILVSMAWCAPAEAAAQDDHPAGEWYGYQAGLADAGAVVLMEAGLANLRICLFADSTCDNRTADRLGLSALALYGFGAPLVHALHGEWGHAGASVALRAAPVGLALVLAPRAPAAAGLAAFGGMVAAVIIDDAVLARTHPHPSQLALAPAWDPATRSRLLVLARRF